VTAPARGGGAAGFTLVEVLVSLVLLLLALALAAQLLGETRQMFADAAREELDPAAALIATRLRGDVQGAAGAVALQGADLSCASLELVGTPEGTIVYTLVGTTLMRSVQTAGGATRQAVVLRGATSFNCQNLPGNGVSMVRLDYQYGRSRTRRSPLPLLPAYWGPRQEQVSETLFLTPRGAGLGGSSW
jgi:prepilin-type N-terminal cleavage/methylation domain-containing protein